MSHARPVVLFWRPRYAPGLEWSELAPLLPGWELRAGEPRLDPRALEGADVFVGALADRAIIQAGEFGLLQQIGTGLDGIDLDAATEAGVWVSRLPAGLTGNADGVADTALLLALAGLRRLDESRRALRERAEKPAGRTLAGRDVAVVGLGEIGARVVRRLLGFGVRITAVRAHPEQGGVDGLDRVVGPEDLGDVVAASDVVMLCARFSPGDPPLLDAAVLSRIRPRAIVVNVARGGLIDEAALLEALDDGRVAAAGLDVFSAEPADPENPLVAHPRVIALPHVAGVTEDMFARAGPELASEILRWQRGEVPAHAVNAPAFSRGR